MSSLPIKCLKMSLRYIAYIDKEKQWSGRRLLVCVISIIHVGPYCQVFKYGPRGLQGPAFASVPLINYIDSFLILEIYVRQFLCLFIVWWDNQMGDACLL
jgi:hypothetical protein